MTLHKEATENYTREMPGCYHSALSYASDTSGIPLKKEIVFDSVQDLVFKNKKGKMELKYRRRDIWVEKDGQRYWSPYKRNVKGGGIVITTSENVNFPVGTKWDRVGVCIDRGLSEFGLPIKPEGTYRDSLGGGWYQNVELYSINGKFFANMDCAH